MHEVFHDAIHYFTHADKGIFQLLKELALHNGKVAREYVNGRRKKYFPPLNFYLLVAAIHVFTATICEKNTAHQVRTAYQAADHSSMQAIRMQRLVEANHFLNHYGNLTAMFILPFTALILFLFYKKGRYNYTEHLIASMYMAGFCILIYATLLLPAVTIFNIPGSIGAAVFFLLQLVYFTTFYYNFFEKTTKKQFLKALIASFFAVSWWFVLSASLIVVYMSTGFWGIFG